MGAPDAAGLALDSFWRVGLKRVAERSCRFGGSDISIMVLGVLWPTRTHNYTRSP